VSMARLRSDTVRSDAVRSDAVRSDALMHSSCIKNRYGLSMMVTIRSAGDRLLVNP
jgi:hypothetical protein